MIYIDNEKDLDELVKEGVTIVDFYADWCGPCRMLSTVIDELAFENDTVKFAKVNVDDSADLARKYRISAIPAIFFFKDGKLVKNEVGFKTLDDLKELLEEVNGK